MSLKTRLSKSSDINNKLTIRHKETQEIIAVIKTVSAKSELEIITDEGYFIEKPSGWKSK